MRAIRRTRNGALAASTFFSGGTGIAAPVPEKAHHGPPDGLQKVLPRGFTCYAAWIVRVLSFSVFNGSFPLSKKEQRAIGQEVDGRSSMASKTW